MGEKYYNFTFTRELLVLLLFIWRSYQYLGLYNTDGIYLEGNVMKAIAWHFPERLRKIMKYISIAGVSAEFLSC